MSDQLSQDDVARVQALIQRTELRGIQFHEYGAKQYLAPAEDVEDDQVKIDLGIQHRIEESNFAVRMNCELRAKSGEATVSVAAEYGVADEEELVKRDVLMFANEVAVMALFPFAREAMSELTNKVLGNRVLLPIAQRGEIAFDLEDEQSGLDTAAE